jgi:hypothetical protein
MKHLRIELVGELDDLLLGDVQRLGFEPVAHFYIVEVMLFHSGLFRSFQNGEPN